MAMVMVGGGDLSLSASGLAVGWKRGIGGGGGRMGGDVGVGVEV